MSAAEPLSEREVADLERSDEEWRGAANGFSGDTVRRLLATIRSREHERDLAVEMRERFAFVADAATKLADGMSATIRARDEELARLREELDAAKASALALHHIAFRQA